MSVFLIGLNHTTAPVALRERLYISSAHLGDLLNQLCSLPGIAEAVVLSTCNRTEITVSGESPAALVDALAQRAGIGTSELAAHLYTYQGRFAVNHLFRVACGLDSLVIGEMQILKQIRDALDTASQCGAAGRHLTGLFQQAIATGKRARTETAISEGAFSIGRAGVELARTLFPDLSASPVLILGAGKMSELTAKHLAASGVHSIFVANRTHAHAEELAHRLGGHALRYENLEQALIEVDILISSTSAPHLILHAADIARVMDERRQRPLCLIDIAVPRDIDPAAAELPNVHLYNIDDLREVTAADRCQRLAEMPRVEAIIAEEVERCCAWQAGLDATPVIRALRDSFEAVRRAELNRATNILADLTPEQQQAVEQMTASMVNKLLHTPTVRLKELQALHPEQQPQQWLCELFALHEPAGSTHDE